MRTLFSIPILFFIFFAASLNAIGLISYEDDFKNYQKTLSHDHVQEKIISMLQKDKEVEDFYKLTESALYLYASPEDKASDNPEFTLHLGNEPKPGSAFPPLDNPYMPLKGLRVAIDPGHLGGDYGRLEEKYIDLPANEKQNILEPIYFQEGDLVLVTAKKLANKLESLGAKVILTRTSSGESAYKKPFATWHKEEFDHAVSQMISLKSSDNEKITQELWWQNKATPSEVFRLTYAYLDIKRRADLINAFKPHLTVSCHYNLGGIYDDEGKSPGVDFDYCLYFVPGAFRKGIAKNEFFSEQSLKSERSRYEFIRLLVTDDIEQSIDLAKIALKYNQQAFKTPTGDDCGYHKVFCMQNQPGIYHRNLALPRHVHGPVLYGEPLCQDNFSNAKALSTNPDSIIDKVVDIYSKTVLDWAQNRASGQ